MVQLASKFKTEVGPRICQDVSLLLPEWFEHKALVKCHCSSCIAAKSTAQTSSRSHVSSTAGLAGS